MSQIQVIVVFFTNFICNIKLLSYVYRQMDLLSNIQVTKSILSEERAGAFMTSLDVIQKIMNVPTCALASLLRTNGYDNIDDTSSLCIDEKRLEIFAEAYMRKIRSYFISSLRNVNKLPPKELSSFEQFIELFKNKNLQREPSKQSDIDVEHLIEIFKKKVEDETSSKLSVYITRLTDLFEKITVDKKELAFHPLSFAIRPTYEVYSANEEFRLGNQVLDAVIQSYYYIAKSIYVRREWHISFFIRSIYVATGYHILSSGSDDDFNSKKEIASYN